MWLQSRIAHFQKEWKTGARVGARSVLGSFGAHEVENKCTCAFKRSHNWTRAHPWPRFAISLKMHYRVPTNFGISGSKSFEYVSVIGGKRREGGKSRRKRSTERGEGKEPPVFSPPVFSSDSPSLLICLLHRLDFYYPMGKQYEHFPAIRLEISRPLYSLWTTKLKVDRSRNSERWLILGAEITKSDIIVL